MHKFGPSTDRIKFMYQLIRDRVIQTDAERALITTESDKRNDHVVPIIKRARAAYDVCSQMTIRVEDFEIIIGNKARSFLGSGNDYPAANGISPPHASIHYGVVLGMAISRFIDGMALNIRFHPSALSREDGIAKLRGMTKTYLNNGGRRSSTTL
jgi:hypothetical protein